MIKRSEQSLRKMKEGFFFAVPMLFIFCYMRNVGLARSVDDFLSTLEIQILTRKNAPNLQVEVRNSLKAILGLP